VSHIAPHHVRPRHHRIMAQGQLVFPVCGVEQVVDALKPLVQVALFDPASVVIPYDQMLLPFELPEIFLRRFFVSEHEITKDINRIGICNFVVPLFDENSIHLFDTSERSIAETDDVAMPKMEIACEEYHQRSPRFLC